MENLEPYIKLGSEKALAGIKEKFELAPGAKDKLSFHNTEHTQGVIGRTEKILKALGASEKDVELGRLAAAFHDTVQGWEENVVDDGSNKKSVRKRFAGDNESKSAEEAVSFMEGVNGELGQPIFSGEDEERMKEAIAATIPGFNSEKSTVMQPNLSAESSPVARALALADLGTAGMEGPDSYLAEGDKLFREENLDIMDALSKPEGLTDDQKEYFRTRMVNWSKFQSKFAKGRKELLDSELAGLPEQGKEAVKELFSKFDDSILAAEQVAAVREKMGFSELLTEFGYKEPTYH